MNQNGQGRLLGSAFAAMFAIAIVSLLVGFGVPVGIGAAAGFVFGALVGLVSVFWIARGPGRAVTIGSANWSSSGGAGADLPEMARVREMTELVGVDLGRTRQVIPVLATAEAGGHSVQVMSAQIHDAGIRLDVEVRRQPGSTSAGFMAEVSLEDDLGTTYRAAGQNAGGSATPDLFTVVAVPAPPAAARRLVLRIERFADPFPSGAPGAEGPWAFEIELRPTAS